VADQYPVFIPTRDRLAPLLQLLDWLHAAGQHEICLVDSQSTYGPMVDFLDRTTLRTVRLPYNLGHRSPFLSGTVQRSAHGRFFIVTDPDVIPDEACPPDVLQHFQRLLERHPDVDKVGFGLRIDDLPEHFALRDDVIRWEQQFWRDEVAPGVFRADLDTTFAMYRPLDRRHEMHRALRTGAPYVARHLPWYTDSAHLDPEETYYRAHADPTMSNWNRNEVARWKSRRMAAAGAATERA
jgi:hypothetical protein